MSHSWVTTGKILRFRGAEGRKARDGRWWKSASLTLDIVVQRSKFLTMQPETANWLAWTLYSVVSAFKVALFCFAPALPVLAWLIFKAVRKRFQKSTLRAGLSTRESELGRADETEWSKERLRRFGIHRHRRHHHHHCSA